MGSNAFCMELGLTFHGDFRGIRAIIRFVSGTGSLREALLGFSEISEDSGEFQGRLGNFCSWFCREFQRRFKKFQRFFHGH